MAEATLPVRQWLGGGAPVAASESLVGQLAAVVPFAALQRDGDDASDEEELEPQAAARLDALDRVVGDVTQADSASLRAAGDELRSCEEAMAQFRRLHGAQDEVFRLFHLIQQTLAMEQVSETTSALGEKQDI